MKDEISVEALDAESAPELEKQLDTYSIKELESLAIDVYKHKNHDNQPFCLGDILSVRRNKINKDFIWSDKNKGKIIHLNDTFFNIFKQAYDEISIIADDIVKRIPDGGCINSDYGLGIVINPKFSDDYRCQLHEVLLHYEEEYHGLANIPNTKGLIIYDFELDPEGYLDKSTHCYNEQYEDRCFGQTFNGVKLNAACMGTG
jgi:hypothetical protein